MSKAVALIGVHKSQMGCKVGWARWQHKPECSKFRTEGVSGGVIGDHCN